MLGSRTGAVWRERLRRYDQARQTVAEFCQREGVSVPSFYQWRRRLAEASTGQRSKRSTRGRRHASPAFQQVTLAGGPVVAVELPSGVRVELPAGQVQLVRAVVADLLQAEAGRRAGDL